MIEIKVTGFKEQTIEFAQPNAALAFLTQLRQEHHDFISPLLKSLVKPSPFYPPAVAANSEPTSIYRAALRVITKKHPLKVEIFEYEDMMDLV